MTTPEQKESMQVPELKDGTEITFTPPRGSVVTLFPAQKYEVVRSLKVWEGDFTLKKMTNDKEKEILAIESPEDPGKYFGLSEQSWQEYAEMGYIQIKS